MKLSQLVTGYIIFKQSMGMRFRAESVILKAFCRAMGDIDIAQVKANSVQDYLAGTGPITTFWHRKFDALSGFYRFALNRGYVSSSPLPTIIPKRPVPFQPYIYTQDQFRRLLEMTDILDSSGRCQVQPATFRTLLFSFMARDFESAKHCHFHWPISICQKACSPSAIPNFSRPDGCQ